MLLTVINFFSAIHNNLRRRCQFSRVYYFFIVWYLVTWQLGLVEREINELLRGITAHQDTKTSLRKNLQPTGSEQTSEDQDSGLVPQREINEDDVCPVCQDELLKKHEPVTYCR